MGEWARVFCQSFSSYQGHVATLSKRLDERLRAAGESDLRGQKAALERYLSATVVETESFRTELTRAGAPAIKRGRGLVKMIVDAFADFRTTLKDAARDARRLPVSDRAEFNSSVATINDTIRTGSLRSRETIARARIRYETRELDRAFDHTPDCQRI